MIRKALVIAAAGIAIIAASSLAPSRANAMPNGLPAAAIDQIDITEAVALCFYIDGWNGPGMYQWATASVAALAGMALAAVGVS